MALNNSFVLCLNNLQSLVKGVISGTDALKLNKFDLSYVISKFMMLKETSIIKVSDSSSYSSNYRLYFDLLDNRKLLWDLLFLSEVIKRNDKNLNDLLDSISERCSLSLGETMERNIITCGDDVIPMELKTDDSLEFNSSTNEYIRSGSLYDTIVQAVCIFDIVRNAFGHNGDGEKCYFESSNKIRIQNNSRKNKIDCDIPYKYLAEFGSGIIPLSDDKDISEAVDFIHASIFAICNFVASDTVDILKKTSNERIKYLLSLVDNDYVQLMNLPVSVFSLNTTEERISFFVKNIDGSINKERVRNLRKLPPSVFLNKCNDKILKHIIGSKFDIENLYGVSNTLFLEGENAFQILEKLCSYDEFKLSELNQYPKQIFSKLNDAKRIGDLVNLFGSVLALKKLPGQVFFGTTDISRIKQFLGNSKDPMVLKDIPESAYRYDCLDEKINILMSHNNGLSVIKQLPNVAFKSRFSVSLLKQLLRYDGQEWDNPTKLIGLPECIFTYRTDISRLEILMNGEWDLEKVKGLPAECFVSGFNYDVKKIISNGINIANVPSSIFSINFSLKNINYIFGLNIDTKEEFYDNYLSNEEFLNILNKISYMAFFNFVSIDRLSILMGDNHDITNLYNMPSIMFYSHVSDDKVRLFLNYPDIYLIENKKYRRVLDLLINDSVTAERFKFILGTCFDLEDILKYSVHIFSSKVTDDYLNSISSIIGGVNKLYICPDYVFLNDGVDLERFKNIYNLFPENNKESFKYVPSIFFSKSIEWGRVHKIYQFTNGDLSLIDDLPNELYYCNGEIFDSLFYKNSRVSNDILKSLFNCGDEKLIALAVYMNCVCSLYGDVNRDNVDFTKFNIGAFDFHSNLESTDIDNKSTVNAFDCSLNSAMSNYADLIYVYFKELVSSHDSYIEFLKQYYSFGSNFNVKSLKSMNQSDLINAFYNFKNVVFNHLTLKFKGPGIELIRSVRNCSDHLHFENVFVKNDDYVKQYIGLCDYVYSNVLGVPTRCDTFSALITPKALFESVSKLHNQLLGNIVPNLQLNEVKESLRQLIEHKCILDNVIFDDLWKKYEDWTNEYINNIEKVLSSVYYLKGQPECSNVFAVYAGSDYLVKANLITGAELTYNPLNSLDPNRPVNYTSVIEEDIRRRFI